MLEMFVELVQTIDFWVKFTFVNQSHSRLNTWEVLYRHVHSCGFLPRSSREILFIQKTLLSQN